MSCKGCPEPVMKSEEKIQELVDEQLQYETDIVDNDTYNERMTACENCPSLMYNSTCGHCGCFVQFRAKLLMVRSLC